MQMVVALDTTTPNKVLTTALRAAATTRWAAALGLAVAIGTVDTTINDHSATRVAVTGATIIGIKTMDLHQCTRVLQAATGIK